MLGESACTSHRWCSTAGVEEVEGGWTEEVEVEVEEVEEGEPSSDGSVSV